MRSEPTSLAAGGDVETRLKGGSLGLISDQKSSRHERSEIYHDCRRHPKRVSAGTAGGSDARPQRLSALSLASVVQQTRFNITLLPKKLLSHSLTS